MHAHGRFRDCRRNQSRRAGGFAAGVWGQLSQRPAPPGRAAQPGRREAASERPEQQRAARRVRHLDRRIGPVHHRSRLCRAESGSVRLRTAGSGSALLSKRSARRRWVLIRSAPGHLTEIPRHSPADDGPKPSAGTVAAGACRGLNSSEVREFQRIVVNSSSLYCGFAEPRMSPERGRGRCQLIAGIGHGLPQKMSRDTQSLASLRA